MMKGINLALDLLEAMPQQDAMDKMKQQLRMRS